MPDDVPAPRPSDWLGLLRVFGMACDPAKLRLGFTAVAFGIILLLLAAVLLVEVQHLRGSVACRHIRRDILRRDIPAAIDRAGEALVAVANDARTEAGSIAGSVLSGRFFRAIRDAGALQGIAVVLAALAAIGWFPWSYYGGALSRAAAVQHATGRPITAAQACRWAASRFGGYFWPPVIVVLFIALFGGLAALIALAAAHLAAAVVATGGGVLTVYVLVYIKQKTMLTAWGRIAAFPFAIGTILGVYHLWSWTPGWLVRAGQVVLIVAFPVLLILGLLAALLLVLLVFGRGLMAAATSYESTGSLDAITRAADYLRRRPWHYLACALVAKATGAVCLAFVLLIAGGAFLIASVLAWAGFGDAYAPVHDSLLAGGRGDYAFELVRSGLVNAVFLALAALVGGWVVAFSQSYWAVCYAFLRRRVDGTPPGEICPQPSEAAP
jgi:hypothetical protein